MKSNSLINNRTNAKFHINNSQIAIMIWCTMENVNNPSREAIRNCEPHYRSPNKHEY